jgi:hypothetical protein
MNEKLEIPQAWGLAIQKHPLQFQGLKYKSRFNDCSCLALFNRNGIERSLTDTVLETLSGLKEAVDWLDKYRVSLY